MTDHLHDAVRAHIFIRQIVIVPIYVTALKTKYEVLILLHYT